MGTSTNKIKIKQGKAGKYDEETPLITADTSPNSGCNFCQTLFLIFGVLFIYFFYTTYVRSQPKPSELQIKSISVYPFDISLSTSQITAQWNISLAVQNPNDNYPISYEALYASVSYHDELISGGIIESFDQKPNEATVVNTSILALQVGVSLGTAKSMEKELAMNGSIEFGARLAARIRLLLLTGRKYEFSASCDNLKVAFGSNAKAGTMSGGERDCKVDIEKIW